MRSSFARLFDARPGQLLFVGASDTIEGQKEVRRALAAQAIPVKIDLDQVAHAEVIRRYGGRAIPTLLIVDGNGEVLARGNFMGVEALVKFLRKA